MLLEVAALTKFKGFAIVAALAAGTSNAAMAEYPCTPGYARYGGFCQPVPPPGYSNPVSGTVCGEATGAAERLCNRLSGWRVVGGALGAAGGALAGTADMLGAPGCAAGYYYYNGYFYPR